MGLIKDIKDIQPPIDASNIKGSLREWDIVQIDSHDKFYIVIFNMDLLYEIRNYFNNDFVKENGLPVFIGSTGFLSTNKYNNDLTHSDSRFNVKKIYRHMGPIADELKNKTKNLLCSYSKLLSILIKTDKYELIWER